MCAVTDLFIALLPNHGTYSFLCFHLKAFNSRIAYCCVEFNLCWWFFVRILFFPQESSGEKKEYLFKVLVIGDLGVGKTSIIKRYVHQFFSVHYRATISFARFKSTGKFTEHILFNHSPTYVTHLQDTSYWCDTLTYVMKVTIVISDERYGFVCLLFYILHRECVCLPFVFVCFCQCLLTLRNTPHCFISCLHFSWLYIHWSGLRIKGYKLGSRYIDPFTAMGYCR